VPLSGATSLEARIVPCDALPEIALQIVARPLDDSTEASPVEIELPLGTVQGRLNLARAQSWSVRVVAPGLWSEEHRASSRSDDRMHLHVWPEARLAGKLEVPRNETLPQELILRLQPVRQTAGGAPACAVEEIVSRCRTESDGAFSCALPAGRWNLRIKAEGWSPNFSWDLPLQSGRPLRIGSVLLRRGATILGEVTTVDGPASPEATLVELLPFDATIPESDSIGRRARAERAKLNAQGFFVFEDVSPGLYRIRAHQPGYSEAGFGPLEVVAGGDTRLIQPIVLSPPVRLVVQIEPVHTQLGGVWTVEVSGEAEAERSSQPVKGQADDEGRWASPELVPGAYLVEVFDERGNRFAWRDSVEIVGVDAFLAIDLDLVRVKGRVSMGDDPVSGEIWFGGETGTERVRATSDEEGEFEIVLPRAGAWVVDVVARDSGIRFRGHEVEVTEGDELQIDLPATEIAGEVLDGNGRPVPGAMVRMVLLGSDSALISAETGADGDFSVRGVREGAYWIHAESGVKSSSTVLVEVAEGLPSTSLRLVVEERRSYTGRVLSGHGGVAGAVVVGLPTSGAGPPEAPVEAVTGPDGRFQLSLPATATDGQIVVLPPGFAPTVVRFRDGGPGEIHVAPAAGAVRLSGFSDLSAGEVPLLLIDQEPVDPHLLQRWAAMNGIQHDGGDGWLLPSMPAGVYGLCVVSFDEAILIVTGRAHPTRCARGVLQPGGDLALHTP
jgi:hypothetical protein